MKRIVIGSHPQCMSIVKKSERMKENGYDYYEVYPTTNEEYESFIGDYKRVGEGVTYFHKTAPKFWKKGELYTLILHKS